MHPEDVLLCSMDEHEYGFTDLPSNRDPRGSGWKWTLVVLCDDATIRNKPGGLIVFKLPSQPEFINIPEIPDHHNDFRYYDPLVDLSKLQWGDDDRIRMATPESGVPMYG